MRLDWTPLQFLKFWASSEACVTLVFLWDSQRFSAASCTLEHLWEIARHNFCVLILLTPSTSLFANGNTEVSIDLRDIHLSPRLRMCENYLWESQRKTTSAWEVWNGAKTTELEQSFHIVLLSILVYFNFHHKKQEAWNAFFEVFLSNIVVWYLVLFN